MKSSVNNKYIPPSQQNQFVAQHAFFSKSRIFTHYDDDDDSVVDHHHCHHLMTNMSSSANLNDEIHLIFMHGL